MKESGIGRENGVEAFESCEFRIQIRIQGLIVGSCGIDTQSKSTIINTSTADDMSEKEDWFADTEGEKRYG
jgi:hypothetical protein